MLKFKVGDEEKTIKLNLELTKDGKANMTGPGKDGKPKTEKGTYKVVDDKTLELTSDEKKKTEKKPIQ